MSSSSALLASSMTMAAPYSILVARQAEGDGRTGTARVRVQRQLIGHLPGQPQAVPGLAGPAVGQVQAVGVGCARSSVVTSARRRCGGAVVIDAAIQRADVVPDPQPPGSRAMPYSVGCQFVQGDDDVGGAVWWHPGLDGAGVRRRSQREQRGAIEPLIEGRRRPGLGWFVG